MTSEATLVVNLHREKNICVPCLASAFDAVVHANRNKIVLEMLIVLDDSDDETENYVRPYSHIARICRINEKDLGKARNFAVANSNSEYIGFLDGDDLCSCNWISQSIAELRNSSDEVIVHPFCNYFFGPDFDSYYVIQPDMRIDFVPIARLLAENIWTSPIFASRKTLTNYPYHSNDLENGVGYEDWSFNIETFVSGVKHITASDTLVCVRTNQNGSLSNSQYAAYSSPKLSQRCSLQRILGGIRGTEVL